MSQELGRHPCLWKPAWQHPAESFCLVLQGWMGGERGRGFQLVVEGTLRLAWRSVPSPGDPAHPGELCVG